MSLTKPRVPADRLQLGLEFIRFQLSREMPGPGLSTRTVYEEIEAALVELQERRTADEPASVLQARFKCDGKDCGRSFVIKFEIGAKIIGASCVCGHYTAFKEPALRTGESR